MMLFVVPGSAAPQGSKKAVRLRNGKTVLLEVSRRVKPWRNVVAYETARVFKKPIEYPVEVHLAFVFPRPASHFTAKGAIKKSAPCFPGKNLGDLDKLCRAALDGMTGIAYRDDSQVVSLYATKKWGTEAATEIRIFTNDGVDPYTGVGYPPAH